MQCKCGGQTITRIQPKVRNKVKIAQAELDVCEGCGRNAGPVRLYLLDKSGNKVRQVDEKTIHRATERAARKRVAKKRRSKS